jgi:hypothetical protein
MVKRFPSSEVNELFDRFFIPPFSGRWWAAFDIFLLSNWLAVRCRRFFFEGPVASADGSSYNNYFESRQTGRGLIS